MSLNQLLDYKIEVGSQVNRKATSIAFRTSASPDRRADSQVAFNRLKSDTELKSDTH